MSDWSPNLGGGLLIPRVRATTQPLFASTGLTLTQQQIADILNDPNRKPAVKRFPPAQWIKSQGGRGSCNGYACAKALERSRVIRGLPHVALSGEYVYSTINGGRDGGSMLDDGMATIVKNGVAPEAMVPHQEYLWNRIGIDARQAAPRFKAHECYGVETELELASAIALGFVCVIAVHASGNYSRLDSRGVSAPSPGSGNHSVGCHDVRIYNGRFEFQSFNSWGTRWGDLGHNWVTWRDHLASTNRYHFFFAIRSSGDDPQGDNPPAIS